MLILSLGIALASPLPPALEPGLHALLAQQCQAVMGWRWTADDGAPDTNLGGVIANALLDAYERHPAPAAWVTMVQYAEHLKIRHAADDALPYKADIEFLARLGAAGIDPAATTLARTLFDRVRAVSPTGAAEYRRIAAGREATPEIVGYDAALAVRAAHALGALDYAHGLAQATLAGNALALADPTDSFAITAIGALTQALARLDPARYRAAISAATERLVHAQAENGAWANNNTQATAHAVLALLATADAAAQAAARRGQDWLLRGQLRTGAWPAYHDGVAEPFVGPVLPIVEAETLAALLQ